MNKTCATLAATLAFGLSSTPVPAGSFVVHHPNKIHWDGAKDEEVIVQIMASGRARRSASTRRASPKNKGRR